MERTIKMLMEALAEPEVLDNNDLRENISEVIIGLNTIIAMRKKNIVERPSSPCPCGTCD
jgi:hypothetical protein